MCAGSTYYFLLFKAVWVLHGKWAKKQDCNVWEECSPEEKVMKKIESVCSLEQFLVQN